MEKSKKMTFGVLAILIMLLPFMLLLTACGSYEIEHGTYKIVGYTAINTSTNESTNYSTEDTLPVSFKFTSDLTLNDDGSVSDCLVINSYGIDGDGNVEFKYDDSVVFEGYFEGDVLHFNSGEYKSTEDIRNGTPDEQSTFYTIYAIYTLNGTPLPATDSAA